MKRQLSFDDIPRPEISEPEVEAVEGDEELPEGWASVTISKVADLALGKMLDRGKRTRGQMLPYIRNINVRWGAIDLSDLAEMPFEEHEFERYALRPGDVLVCEGGEPGRAAVWEGNTESIKFQKAIHRVRATDALEPKWVVHVLRHLSNTGEITEFFTGTTIKHLTGVNLARLPLPLPPRSEQRRIVAKLDSLSEKSRRARAALDEVPELLEKLRQSILAAAFRGDLTAEWRESNPQVETAEELVARTPAPAGKSTGRAASESVQPGRYAIAVGNPNTPAPDGWAWIPLSRVAQMGSGHTPSREHEAYWNGEIPWIGIADAREHHGRVIETTLQTITEEGLANSAARLLPAMTVCLSRTASVGYVTIMGRPMATSQDFANWTCTEALLPKYLMYALLAEGDGLRDFGEGSTHTTIYFPELKAFHICLAPLEEQRRIVELIEARLAVVEAIARVVAEAREAHATIDRSLLAKAFRGELVPQDPNDEPASVMLARLREERAAAAPGKTRVQRRARGAK